MSGPQIDWNGKTWTVGRPTQRAKKALERLVIAQATAEVAEVKGVVSQAVYDEMFAALRLAIEAKQYRTWKPGWRNVVNGPDGGILFFLSLLREVHPEASLDDARGLLADREDEVSLALAEVAPTFFGLLVDDPTIPPDRRPELVAQMLAAWTIVRATVIPQPTTTPTTTPLSTSCASPGAGPGTGSTT